MSRVSMIQHINIQISDKDRTREWYEKVLGAEFLDRGPELNKRQLQLRIGSGEIHSTHTPTPAPSGHFALEIHDWDEMIANMDALGVSYTPPTVREYSNGHSTYIHDPDGNMIEFGATSAGSQGFERRQGGGGARSQRADLGQTSGVRPFHLIQQPLIQHPGP